TWQTPDWREGLHSIGSSGLSPHIAQFANPYFPRFLVPTPNRSPPLCWAGQITRLLLGCRRAGRSSASIVFRVLALGKPLSGSDGLGLEITIALRFRRTSQRRSQLGVL